MICTFTSILVTIAVLSIYVISGVPQIASELGPSFEASEAIGPIYIEYSPQFSYREFLHKTSRNTSFWYFEGQWFSYAPLCYWNSDYIPPSILGWSSVKNDTIDLYTGNYLYPLLKNQPLPLGKTFLGSFELSSGESVIADQTAYLRYFGEGVLNAYKFSTNKQVAFSEDLRDSLSDAFLEWYGSWANLDNFKLYRHFYFPIDREYPDWVTILQIVKEAYPHSSSVQLGENWEDSCETLAFTSIDFIESSGKVALYIVNPEIWSSMYTEEQAIFRYYDIENGTIHFWTPHDLILDHEIRVIAGLINKKPEEVLAVFSNWLSGTGPYNNLYFNYVGESSFDWINDPWYDIAYVY